MTTLRIKRLNTLFRLPPSQMEERGRLNSLLQGMVMDMLPLLLEEQGISPNSELCIKSLHVPVALRLSNPDQPVALSWCRALSEEIGRQIETGGDHVVLYRSRNHALILCAEKIAQGDLGHAWAWRSLGIGDFKEKMTGRAAMACFMNSLAREGGSIIPVLLHAARRKFLNSFLGTGERRIWTKLAAGALASAGRTWSPSKKRAGARVHGESLALRIMEQSKIMQGFLSSLPGFLADDEMVYPAAILALLEVEPAFVRMTHHRMGSAIEIVAGAVRAARGSRSHAGGSGSDRQSRYDARGHRESGGRGSRAYGVGGGTGENASVGQSGYDADGKIESGGAEQNGSEGEEAVGKRCDLAGGPGSDGQSRYYAREHRESGGRGSRAYDVGEGTGENASVGQREDGVGGQRGYDAEGSIESGGAEQNGSEGGEHNWYPEKREIEEPMCKRRGELEGPEAPSPGTVQIEYSALERYSPVERPHGISGKSSMAAGESVREHYDSIKSPVESSPFSAESEVSGAGPENPVELSSSESGKEEQDFSCSPLELPGEEVTTEWGGVLFLINAMNILSLPEEIAGGSLFENRGMRWIMCRLATSIVPARGDDPAVMVFSGLSPPGKPLVAGESQVPGLWKTTVPGTPVGSWERSFETPSEDASEQIMGWRRQILDYLRRALSWNHLPEDILIQRLCRRKTRIIADPGWIELQMHLEEVSVDIRRAGLDLDPGYVPWLGVVIKFHYL